MGFVCVSLGSTTVQLHDSVGSRRAWARSNSQNSDRAWGVHYRRAALCCLLCGQNDSMQRIFRKKRFLFMVGSVCHVQRFTAVLRNCHFVATVSLITKRLKRSCRSGWDNSQKLLCCGFRRTDKAMGQMLMNMSRNKCIFQVRLSYFLRFISIC
jgi:hypothetical protein